MVPLREKKFLVCAAALLSGCAGQVPPPGGPRDTVPPAIIRTVPDTNATRTSPKEITLEFSKYVDRRSVEESIFISPPLGDITYDWSGREVTMTWSGTLRAGTTYVVTVGTDVADLREGNRMASSFALAFATGDSIDRGSVSGRVYDDKPSGVLIFAYRLTGIRPDTLDPSHTKPDYVTQTGSAGTFALVHIAMGAYRVLAVRDEYHNLVYDAQVDQFGAPPGDITLTRASPAHAGLFFRLAMEDTTPPFLSGARAGDSRRLALRFSEPLDSASLAGSSVRVVDTLSGRDVPLLVHYLERGNPSSMLAVTAVPLDSPAAYRVSVRGVRDRAGNLLDTLHAAETIEGTHAPDTVRPSITLQEIGDSARGIIPGASLDVRFSDAVAPFRLGGGVTLTDSTHADVAALSAWTGPASFNLVPGRPLASKMWYTLRVVMDSVRSLTGRGYRDSVFTRRFQSLDLRTTGSISGRVEDALGSKSPVVLTVTGIDANPPRSSAAKLKSPGEFTVGELPEGKYTISAFLDSGGKGLFESGRPAPFHPADRFAVYPDTIRVRARWGVENLTLRIQ
ncbi:MAG TPA: Ig-like domain-containing protein [Bacteroidota bacterium]|nr:Ig-like domain-containing protein [Bacteroidota bacterium]